MNNTNKSDEGYSIAAQEQASEADQEAVAAGDCPIADDWLDDEALLAVREQVKREIGSAKLTCQSDIFSALGL